MSDERGLGVRASALWTRVGDADLEVAICVFLLEHKSETCGGIFEMERGADYRTEYDVRDA